MTSKSDSRDLLEDLIRRARAAGAEAADAVAVEQAAISHAQRLGQLERMEREETRDIGLRVLIGRRQAVASSSDDRAEALSELVERAVAMARAVPEDRYCGLAEAGQIAKTWPELVLCDPDEPAPETLIERTKACEEAACAVQGVTNSEGAEASWSRSRITLAASNGFVGSYERSSHGLGVAVLAGSGTKMERDYDFTTALFAADLEDAGEVGKRAGERAVKRLGARKVKTRQAPVIFDPRVSAGLVGAFAGAINGLAVARGTSFLKDAFGKQVFVDGIEIIDDPHLPRGRASKPFDGEGLANKKRSLVEKGVLASWILNLSAARQLGLDATGHAARGTGAPPGIATTNLYMAPGKDTPEALVSGIDQGFYVTEMMGMGVNQVTGDYSRGASGFWIEKGEIVYPVSEMTVAGNLKDMFMAMTPASDLVFRYATNAPTLLVEGMTVAGN